MHECETRPDLPRDHVAVMLHDRGHDLIPLLKIIQTPRLRYEVDRLGSPTRKHDLTRCLRVYQRRDLFSCLLQTGKKKTLSDKKSHSPRCNL